MRRGRGLVHPHHPSHHGARSYCASPCLNSCLRQSAASSPWQTPWAPATPWRLWKRHSLPQWHWGKQIIYMDGS
jgi:hypothetical protein